MSVKGKDRIEMTLDYAAEADAADPGLPKGNAFMQGGNSIGLVRS